MKFSKDYIIDKIKRTAQENGGKPLGKGLFYKKTGIRESDWSGKFWARWGDAVKEAGYKPNTLQMPYNDEWIIEKLVSLIRELGHYPTAAEIQMKARADKGFPHGNTIRRIGNKFEIAPKAIEYCRRQSGFDEVVEICESIDAPSNEKKRALTEAVKEEVIGYVYMTKVSLKNVTSYKIGFSNSLYKRIQQLNTRSPVEEVLIHKIETNDPQRSEQYWHKKYSNKREPRTEYFNLRRTDIQLFKKYMC